MRVVQVVVGRTRKRLQPLERRLGQNNKRTEHLGHFMKTPNSDRHYCTQCGGNLFTKHPPMGLTDVYAATIPTLDFQPAVHVNYAETVLPMKDGLPKLRDFPAEMGGSGEMVEE